MASGRSQTKGFFGALFLFITAFCEDAKAMNATHNPLKIKQGEKNRDFPFCFRQLLLSELFNHARTGQAALRHRFVVRRCKENDEMDCFFLESGQITNIAIGCIRQRLAAMEAIGNSDAIFV